MPIESAAEIRCRVSSRAVARVIDRGAVRLAHAVDHDNEAFVPAGGEVRRCGMGQVMVGVPDPVERQVGQGPPHLRRERLAREHVVDTARARSGRAAYMARYGRVVKRM